MQSFHSLRLNCYVQSRGVRCVIAQPCMVWLRLVQYRAGIIFSANCYHPLFRPQVRSSGVAYCCAWQSKLGYRAFHSLERHAIHLLNSLIEHSHVRSRKVELRGITSSAGHRTICVVPSSFFIQALSVRCSEVTWSKFQYCLVLLCPGRSD